MRGWFHRSLLVIVLVSMAGVFAGCAADSRPRKSLLSADPDRELIKPGMVGNNAPADRRRGHFDFWNEEILHESVAVGTVFMGDSITELWELGAYFAPSDGIIVNRGIGGDVASVMAKRFAADVIQLRPRNVVILAGTNDVARMLNKKVSDEEMIQSVVQSMGQMMDASRTAGLNTLVCSILPTNSDNRAHTGKKRVLGRINKIVRSMCREKGCVYVDYCARMTDGNGDLPQAYSRDGLHPHVVGYRIMVDVLLDTAARHGLSL